MPMAMLPFSQSPWAPSPFPQHIGRCQSPISSLTSAKKTSKEIQSYERSSTLSSLSTVGILRNSECLRMATVTMVDGCNRYFCGRSCCLENAGLVHRSIPQAHHDCSIHHAWSDNPCATPTSPSPFIACAFN